MENQTQLSVIIPAYNEGEAIASILEQMCKNPALKNAEIVVVDDGSSDTTCEKVQNFPRVHLVRHPNNRGYGAAISTGVKASHGRYIVWFDADGQHRIEDLVIVAQTLIQENLDYCIGARETNSFQDPSRKPGKFILKSVVRLAIGSSVKDFNSGLRGFKSEVIRKYLHLLPKGFGASTTTTLIMVERGYFGKEVPIVVQDRLGTSSVNQLRDGAKTLMLILRIFLLFKPLQFFGGIGLTFVLVGSIYGFTKALLYRQGFPVFAALIIIFGIQSIFFGLLADQISSIRREKFE